jgi:hypothetical protein
LSRSGVEGKAVGKKIGTAMVQLCHSLIQLSLSSYYVSAIVLGSRDVLVTKTDKNPSLHGADLLSRVT